MTIEAFTHARALRALFDRVLLASALAPMSACCFLSTRVPAHYESTTHEAPAALADRASGQLTRNECQTYCSGNVRSCYYNAAIPQPTATLQCDYYVPAHCVDNGCMFGCGRVPEGLSPLEACEGASELARYFGRMAQLEAVSVTAFVALDRELHAHGAPASLRRRARAAAVDEARHTRIAAALARRFGGKVRWPAVQHPGVRSLERMAVENASEGCVREAFGALLAQHQARTAKDPRVQRALGAIARDEVRHASLAWAVDAWAMGELSRASRTRVRRAKRTAADEVEATGGEPGAELREIAGVPSGAQTRRMAREFRAALGV